MAKVSKARWLSKVKKRTKGAFKKSREKEPRVKGQQIPGGLVNAVAQFVGYRMDENDEGVPYISLRSVCQEPEENEGTPVNVTHRFVETERKSVADVCDEFASDLTLLGADLEGVDEDGWEDVLKGLSKDKPFFLFNTRAWEFNGRSGVSVFIQGLAEDYEPDEDPDEGEADPDEDPDDDDAAGDDSDEDGGEDPDEEGEPEADAEEADDWTPEKEEVYMYRPTSRSKKQEWEVTSVNKKMKTVALKRVSDGKTAKNVKWDKLEGPDED